MSQLTDARYARRMLAVTLRTMYESGMKFSEVRDFFEREYLLVAIEANGGNYCRAARSLHLHRNTVTDVAKRLGIFQKRQRRNSHG